MINLQPGILIAEKISICIVIVVKVGCIISALLAIKDRSMDGNAFSAGKLLTK